MKVKDIILGERDRVGTKSSVIWRITIPLNKYRNHWDFALNSALKDAIDAYGEDAVRQRLPDNIGEMEVGIDWAKSFFVILGQTPYEADIVFAETGYVCSLWTYSKTEKELSPIYEAVKFALR